MTDIKDLRAYTERYLSILKDMQDLLENKGYKHSQVLSITVKSDKGPKYTLLGMNVTSLDTEDFKQKVKDLINSKFGDDLITIKETKTTIKYVVPYTKYEE